MELCGPNVTLPPSPIELFLLFFTPYLIKLIVDNTNLYAEQVLSAENYLKFEKVMSLEIQAYFGFMLLMGINQLPCLSDCWRIDTTYFTPITSQITRARFLEISRFLHFVNNESYTTFPSQILSMTEFGRCDLSSIRYQETFWICAYLMSPTPSMRQ